MPKYKHIEAFCLMQYEDQVTGEVELIWNSRDGVTPFIALSRAGNESRHIEWRGDRCVPDHVPAIGDRIFVDLTVEIAEEFNRRRVEEEWEKGSYPMKDWYESKEDAIEKLTASMMEPKGQPNVQVVTREIRKTLADKTHR